MLQLFSKIQDFLQEANELQKSPLIALVGPTASGKTALSLEIAKAFKGEIVSADSRQIYKQMDIGTAKISAAEQQGVPHYLLDVVDPSEEFSLADYKRLALKIIQEILRRKHLPIVCGGTGLYINTILENYQIPQVPPQYDLRQKFANYYEEHGPIALHKLLQEHDPEAAARIHPHNVRYVIRALEINIAGNQKKIDQKGEPLFHTLTIGIDWPRDLLYERINKRLDQQMETGLLNEVKTLLMRGYNSKLRSMSSLGYLELITYLKGECSLEEAAENIKKNTRNYAKRQLTWFRRYKDIYWINGLELETYFQQK